MYYYFSLTCTSYRKSKAGIVMFTLTLTISLVWCFHLDLATTTRTNLKITFWAFFNQIIGHTLDYTIDIGNDESKKVSHSNLFPWIRWRIS